MKSTAASVSAYLDELPADRKAALSRLRALVTQGAPEATEAMSYGMPTYAVDGVMLFAFASQKQHLALYVMDKGVVDDHRDALAALDVGKGCIRFKRLDDLPLDAVAAMVRESVARLRRDESRAC